jgi:hypothetical protein
VPVDAGLPSARQLFALLIYIGCPQLVDGFFREKATDTYIQFSLSTLTVRTVPERFWLAFQKKDPGTSKWFAAHFDNTKYKFFLPELNDQLSLASEVPVFEEETILPFLAQQQLDKKDQGGFGKVFSIKLLSEYRHFRVSIHVLCRRCSTLTSNRRAINTRPWSERKSSMMTGTITHPSSF